jgi:hypothetical protein
MGWIAPQTPGVDLGVGVGVEHLVGVDWEYLFPTLNSCRMPILYSTTPSTITQHESLVDTGFPTSRHCNAIVLPRCLYGVYADPPDPQGLNDNGTGASLYPPSILS